ncbi:MAG: DUF393 domain-containing protein [Gorillibacterium sp.]|nr:DUF393 domain-containing protein [Gorillibacterium sp.]
METLTLLYDARCNLCLRTVAILQGLEVQVDLQMIPLQEAKQSVLPEGYTQEELLSELHVIDNTGTVYRGAEAVVRILRTVRGMGWLMVLHRLPGMSKVADWGYRLIARYRYQLFGRTDDCQADGEACSLHNKQTFLKPTELPSAKTEDDHAKP